MAAAGVVLLVFRFLDVRPSAAKVEEAAAKVRKRGQDKDKEPGVRRARRNATEGAADAKKDGKKDAKKDGKADGESAAKAADDGIGAKLAKLTKRSKVKKDMTKEADK